MCGCGSINCAECGPGHTCGTPGKAPCKTCDSNRQRAEERIASARRELAQLGGAESAGMRWGELVPKEQLAEFAMSEIIDGKVKLEQITTDPFARAVIARLIDRLKKSPVYNR